MLGEVERLANQIAGNAKSFLPCEFLIVANVPGSIGGSLGFKRSSV